LAHIHPFHGDAVITSTYPCNAHALLAVFPQFGALPCIHLCAQGHASLADVQTVCGGGFDIALHHYPLYRSHGGARGLHLHAGGDQLPSIPVALNLNFLVVHGGTPGTEALHESQAGCLNGGSTDPHATF